MVFQKVTKGDKKKPGFPAAVYNGIVDILNPKNIALSDVPINTASFRNRTVLVENATGEDITAFSVLSIDGFLFDNDDEEPGGLEWNPLDEEEGLEEILSNGLCFKGIKPTEGKPVAVVIEDINAGDVGEAVLSGPAVVSLDMKSRTHQFAAIVEGEPGHLQSAEEGNIRILGVKKEEGIKTAAVLLGGSGGQTYFEGKIESENNGVYQVLLYKDTGTDTLPDPIEARTRYLTTAEKLENGTIVGVTRTPMYGYRITHCEV